MSCVSVTAKIPGIELALARARELQQQMAAGHTFDVCGECDDFLEENAAFERLLFLDPRYRPDQLVFPPEVSSLFEEVRLRTRAVAVSVPPRRRTACSVGRRNGTDGHSLSCECSLTLRGKKRGMTGWFMR